MAPASASLIEPTRPPAHIRPAVSVVNLHLRLLVIAALVAFAAGCDSGESSQPDSTSTTDDTSAIDVTALPDSTSAPDAMPDATDPSDDAQPLDEFAAVVASYGNITTVAGTGRIEDKGLNGWDAAYEGGAATAAELSRPHITMANSQGHLFIADKDAHAVRRVAPEGTITTFAGTSLSGDDGDGPAPAASQRLSSPNGLWVSPSDVVYVFDLGNDKVRKITTDGTMTTLFTVGGSGAGRGLWVADDESEAYIAAGASLKRWTPTEGVRVVATGFVSLGNLVVNNDGDVVVADRDGHTVYRVSADGTRTPIAGNGTISGGGHGSLALESGLNEVRAVWPYPAGGYLLGTHKGGHIWFMDSDGVLHLLVDGDADDSHSGDGMHFQTPGKKISEPRAVTMDALGNIIITEHDAGYVRIVERIQ